MSKENLARVMKQMQLDPSLQHKQVAAPNADVLNSTKSGELEDRKIKSSPQRVATVYTQVESERVSIRGR